MGTAQRVFEGVLWGGATGSHVTGSAPDRKWPRPEVALTESAPTGSRLCACATGSWSISALVGPFHRKWRHKTSRDPLGFPWKGGVRACATGSCAISTVLGSFDRKWRHKTSRDPLGFPWKDRRVPLEGWGARMRNRKLLNIRLSRAFSPEVTSSNVTWPPLGFPWKDRVRACANGSCVLSDQTSTKCSTVVPWQPVTEGHVTPKGSPWMSRRVCSCATGSCAISALVEPFHRKLATGSAGFLSFFLSTRGCSLRRPRLALVICPFTAILFSFHWLSAPFIFIYYNW